VAGLAGLVNAWAWYGLTAAVIRSAGRDPAGPYQASRPDGQEPARREPAGQELASPMPAAMAAPALAGSVGPAELMAHRIPAGPLALAAVIATVIALTRLVFALGGPIPVGHPDPAAAWMTGTTGSSRPVGAIVDTRHHPVLEIAGFGSWCCGQNRALAKVHPDAVVQQFSYRGTNRYGQPLPYGPKAGNIPLPLLGDRIAAQVQRLHKLTGKPVDIVAESEGTLGVDAMLARHPGAPVGSVALLSPIVAPGQSGYREGGGTGLVTGDELHALIWFVGGLSPYGTSGAQTLINSVNRVGA